MTGSPHVRGVDLGHPHFTEELVRQVVQLGEGGHEVVGLLGEHPEDR